MEKEKLCLRCMRKIGDNTICPYCRNESNQPQADPYLPLKTVVGGRYLIGKVVSENGEGFTYNAFDLEAKKPVSLRELYPKGLLARGEGNYCLVNVGKAADFIDAKDSFIKLWDKLSELKGFTALTPATHVFEDLGTVYAVSEFLGEGQSLREYLLEKEQGFISWDEARVLFMPVLSAIGALHGAGIVHGGISPVNLIIDSNGKMRITGYCVPEMRMEKSSMQCELFDGYAAVEQYGFSNGLGTYSDIYAFAAVLYRALIGSTPISAAARLTNDKLMIPGKFAEQLPAYVINALVNALQILPEDRTSTAEALRDELSASPAAAGTAAEAYSSHYASLDTDSEDETPSVPPLLDDDGDDVEQGYEEESKLKKSTIAVFVVSAVVCLAVLIGVLVGFKGCSDSKEESTSSESESTETVQGDDTQRQTEIGNASIKIPNFVGKIYDDIKNDDKYKEALEFPTLTIVTEYVESAEEKGKILSQSMNAGTEITSLSKRTITLKISDGLEVPEKLVGKSMKDVIDELKNIGFKNIKAESGKVASNMTESNTVYRIVYDDESSSDWAEIPQDRRLSSTDTIIVYYYGEYVETTVTSPSQPTEQPNIQPVQPETSETNSATGSGEGDGTPVNE